MESPLDGRGKGASGVAVRVPAFRCREDPADFPANWVLLAGATSDVKSRPPRKNETVDPSDLHLFVSRFQISSMTSDEHFGTRLSTKSICTYDLLRRGDATGAWPRYSMHASSAAIGPESGRSFLTNYSIPCP